jgi:RNA polymerase primary sigma factor/RNA polymerase sigma factor
MHSKYHSQALRQLRDQQVRFAPRARKIEQLWRIESLLGELEPERVYPYDYLYFRVTGFRLESDEPELIEGRKAQHDLLCLLEDLSDSADISAEDMPEPVYTVEQLSRRFRVSTKTISRWRDQGLASLRLLFGNRKRVGFRHSTVERFVARNRVRVERGARFSQLTDQERGEIIQLARRLARAGGSPSEVIRRVAQQVSRSVETIRYTLKQFDQRHPDLAVFPHKSGPLNEETKKRIYEQYASGGSVDELARRFCRRWTTCSTRASPPRRQPRKSWRRCRRVRPQGGGSVPPVGFLRIWRRCTRFLC